LALILSADAEKMPAVTESRVVLTLAFQDFSMRGDLLSVEPARLRHAADLQPPAMHLLLGHRNRARESPIATTRDF
jgi:hypothetical protein